jgi:predicted cation transporter
VPFDVTANVIILLIVLAAPFLDRRIEHNLEAFLFVMGILSALASHAVTAHLIRDALTQPVRITIAVFMSGLIFARGQRRLASGVTWLVGRIGLRAVLALAVITLGLASSIVTGIIAALVLVEFASVLRLERGDDIRFVVVACYAIGLGAALTPIGEPLSTIATAKLGQDFWYLVRLLGWYVIPGVVALGALLFVKGATLPAHDQGLMAQEPYASARDVGERAVRVYVFVVALTLLGEGFKPLIDRYVIGLDARVLYWINMVSAILDNATLTAAEISPRMSAEQVRAVLMGLLVSGGLLIPGNIPNIIAAGKLKIRSREWAVAAIPIGVVMLVAYFVVMFLVLR